MKIPSTLKKIFAIVLSVALVFGFSKLSVFADEQQVETFSSNYKVLENNDETLSITTKFANTPNTLFKTSRADETVGKMTLDKNTHEITFTTNETSTITGKNEKIYNVVINELTGENGDLINATFTDTETNQTFQIEQDKTTASVPVLVPIGVIIGEWLLAQLLAAGTAVVIGGVTYAIWDSVVSKLRSEKKFNHYQAKIISGQVGIGPGISLGVATVRLASPDIYNNNVWSIDASNAFLVALEAGGGTILAGPELNVDQALGFVYHAHYHTSTRYGGHSFF